MKCMVNKGFLVKNADDEDFIYEDMYKLSKGIVYYTDNLVNEELADKCRKQLLLSNLPIVSVSLLPIDFGTNIHMPLKRGYNAYFRQILAGLEASTADVIFLGEHDWFYHPSHFEFTPPKKDVFYYNDNWWRVRSTDGHAINYRTHLGSTLCAYRDILLENYRTIVKNIEKNGDDHSYVVSMGFEPGTHNRKERPTEYKAESWKSQFPNLDIRHTTNLTASRWKQSDFRSQRNCRDWQEKKAWEIEGWNFDKPYNIINCQSI